VHGMFDGNNQAESKTFTGFISHCELHITLRYWALDTWDGGEYARVYIDNQLWYEDLRTEGASNDAQFCNYEWLTYAGSFPGITKCYKDIELFVPHVDNAVMVTVTSTINQAVADESWGFSNLVIRLLRFLSFLSWFSACVV
jgi:hypothetical protein